LLTIGKAALSCNYGNQRWFKITFHFLQCMGYIMRYKYRLLMLRYKISNGQLSWSWAFTLYCWCCYRMRLLQLKPTMHLWDWNPTEICELWLLTTFEQLWHETTIKFYSGIALPNSLLKCLSKLTF